MSNPLTLIRLILTVALGMIGAVLLSGITIPLWRELIHANIGDIKAAEGLVGDVVFTLFDYAIAGLVILVIPIALAALLIEFAISKFSR